MKVEHILNHQIKLQKVLLFTINGEKLGSYSLKDALALAEQENLDLMQVGEDKDVAICKMVNYDSWRYHEAKKKQKADFKNRSLDLKSINFRPAISSHDFDLKIEKINQFLKNKHKVKVVIQLRGREGNMKEVNNLFIQKIINCTKSLGVVEGGISFGKRDIIFTIKPEKTTN